MLGTTWQVITNLVQADGVAARRRVLPTEGSTAWSRQLDGLSKAEHPNCLYLWLN